ncbi:penicillin-binding transpeptidase domain-containing protein [Chryseomicrobium palamuruense]|uniref:Penicillin-binding transpeptidase domain-containing protein n=1 Tax=Chryseomicrobium palamuruense TaxID=682973 RepID=A0ABV8USV8_9BACL
MNKKVRFQWGAFLLFLFYGGLFFLLLGRFIYIQTTGIVNGEVLEQRAEEKYNRSQILEAHRGTIQDRNGNVLAEDTLSYKIFAVLSESATVNAHDPRHVIDVQQTAEKLSAYIDMSAEDIATRLQEGIDNERYQVEFGAAGRNLSHQVMQKIRSQNIPGIQFDKDLKRHYPNGSFASHLIGFAIKEETEEKKERLIGKMGLERIYDKVMTGTPGMLEYQSDRRGFLLPSSDKLITEPKNGADIYLTNDRTIQNFLEEAVTDVQEQYEPEKVTALVVKADSGEILAMTQRPTFDPNTREGLTTNWLNESVENTIEPGSTMKIFTLAAAIEEGKWDPNAWYKSGSYRLLDRTIYDHNVVGWGSITYLEGFQRSSNVAMAYLLERLGDDVFIDYIKAFGFGEKTGIELPNEAAGIISDRYPINRLTTAYGQGTTVTPLQLIQGMTAIANEGTMYQPFIIDKVVDPNTGENLLDHEPVSKPSPISAATANHVKEILASTVTSETGTAQKFKLDSYTSAGKTGTAQIPDTNGQYLWGRQLFLYSFLGMAPVEDPELIVYVAVHKPKIEPTEVGSDPTSYIYKYVTENALKYLNITPMDFTERQQVEVGDYTNRPVADVQSELQALGLEVITLGAEGNITSQYPHRDTKVVTGNKIFLRGSGAVTVPDMSGWSSREVQVMEQLSGIPMERTGSGFVVSQSVTAGTIADGSVPIVVKLSSPEEAYTSEPIKMEGESEPIEDE